MKKIKDSLRLSTSGRVSIVDITNKKLVFSKKNLVVNTAKTIMASALVGNPSGDYISYISFGDGVNPPLISDRGLYNQVHQIDASYEQQPSPRFLDQVESDGSTTQSATVVFAGILDNDSSFTFSEAGLFSAKQFMFSRITMSPITKTAGSSWLVEWELEMRIS